MSDFSLTLVLQFKTSKIINDMAKVQQKSEKISAFGGIFFVLDRFDHILSSVIDSHVGLRSKLIGYQYSEIIRAVFSVFCCGGDCMEDLNLYLKDVLTERPHTRVPRSWGSRHLCPEATGSHSDGNVSGRRRALLKPLTPSIFPSPYKGDSNMRGGLPQGWKMDDVKVAVVEAEKTAVIMSEVKPEYIWLATGGKTELNVAKLCPLEGRQDRPRGPALPPAVSMAFSPQKYDT